MIDNRFLKMFGSLQIGLWQYESKSDSFSCDQTFLEVFSFIEYLDQVQKLIVANLPKEKFTIEIEIDDKRVFEVSANEEGGNYIGTFKDITDSVEERSHLQELAFYDSLTGLKNRTSCINYLKEHEDKRGFYLYLDIHKFKSINDTFGHTIGDKILIKFSEILKLRADHGEVFRLSGDEFFIHLTYTKFPLVQKVIKQISNDLKNIELPGCFDLRCNIGIVKYKRSEDVSSILQKADLAMYIAKHSKRLDYVLADNNVMDKFIDEVEYNIRMNRILNLGGEDHDGMIVRRTSDESMVHSLIQSIYKNN